jgi:micrococcal nuclease
MATLVLAGCDPLPSGAPWSGGTTSSTGSASPRSGTTSKGTQPPKDSKTPASHTLTGVKVTRVIDGDTIDVHSASGTVRVRILGIDAPENSYDGSSADCGAKAATTALRRLVTGRTVTVTTDPRSDAIDRYGRTLGYVDLAGVDVGLRMITDGMAEAWYPAQSAVPTRDARYRAAQKVAETQKTGQWAHCTHLGR